MRQMMVAAGILAAMGACKKDPLEEIKSKVDIKCSYKVEETGREQISAYQVKIYMATYLQGTVTNNSGKNLTDVVLATHNSRNGHANNTQLIEIGDLAAGEYVDLWEYMFDGAYMSDRAQTVEVRLHSAKIAN